MFKLTMLLATGLPLLLATSALAQKLDALAAFDEFCTARFGAEKEALVYEAFGRQLKFIDKGLWTHPSDTSACIAFETCLPARAFIEYGPTEALGDKTEPKKRFHYVHLSYLRNLKPKTEYHFRLVAVDERGNRITSGKKTFTTGAPARSIRVPDDLDGPPYVLNKSGATYIVTRDLTIDGKAFEVKATNVTLDLNGHTVVYNNKEWPKIRGDFWKWRREAKFGVSAQKGTNGLKVFNGTIRQGKGSNAAQANSIGYNPIFTGGCNNMQLAGLTIQYSGDQQVGIYAHWGGTGSEIHHNVFIDAGAGIANRHGAGSRALLFFGNRGGTPGTKIHHNLVRRTRQSGLGGREVYHNEIYVDSCATNSFGVGLDSSGKAWGNRVFGTGYHMVGFGWGSKQTFSGNFVHLEGDKPSSRFSEYGDLSSVNGFRLTQYRGSSHEYRDNLYENNTVVVAGRGGCQQRGVQFFSDTHVKGLIFRNNTVKATVADDITKRAACVVTQGLHERTDTHQPIEYVDSTFISDTCNIRFGDYYGVGSNHRFIGCTFVRVGDRANYKTFLWDSSYPCKNHVIRDAVFKGGASLESIEFGKGDHDLTVQWTLAITTAPGASVTISDAAGKEVFAGKADAKGLVSTALTQYVRTAKGKTLFTPYLVKVAKAGRTAAAKINADRKQTVTIDLQ